jgi:hypothetical protein
MSPEERENQASEHDRPMTREEWLEFHLERAPEISEEQWRDTLAILELSRNRVRRTTMGEPPAEGEHGGTAA